jgi:aryl carrier-like protein
VNATESRETVSLTFRYLKRSMSEERMSNVAYTFVTILREVIRNPEQTVKQLSHFGERNRNPLWGWNGIVPDKKDACELGAIEYHLRSFLPDGIDVVAELITPVDEESQTILAVFICLRDVLDNGDHGLEDVPVVTRERLIPIVAELEEWLSNSLPEYMIPTMFVPLRRIPLTASGKPDRQKLHQLVSGLSKQQLTARSLDASAKRAPSMELEKRLQLLWANVLNVRADRIGIGDNFFKLGGDSITAMRLVATARAAGIYISVADVFNHSTLSELSLSIAAAEGLTEFGIPTCTSSGTTKTAESFPHDALLQRTTSRALTKELEKQLQQLWAGVLNLRAGSIGISDNFFKLGGDSITAMRLVATARSSGIHISIAHIFGHPTLLDLSLALSIPDRLRRSAKRHTHFPFSSLDFPDVEEFLEEVVCPQITSERFNIEDALIATDMQAAMIAFGLSRNRGNIHYFTLDFDGHIDSSRLKTACQTLISHHPIFRTVFFAHKSQVFQILLRSIPLEFQRYECENSIEDLSKQLINTDRSLPFAPGDRIVRFMFLEHGTYSARLIIRVSHAQYDGICFPIIIKDLKAAYLGEKIEARPPFSDFVYAINKRNGTKAELFWRTLLENSSMTKFSLYKIPSYENHIDSCVMRSIPFISLGSHGITLASIIKAAWAFILAQLSGTNDVVFGHVVSGRNLFLEGIDQIVGPCINVVPVRVRFQSSTVLDLLCLVQNQYLEAIPFETMGFRRIVERCTEWPLWSRFSSVVQHQNLDEILTSCRFGDTNCKIGAISAPHDVVDVAILSSQQGRKTGISLNYSRRVISQPFAEEVLESLCSTILQFSTDVNAQLPSPSSWSTPYPRIPFLNDTGHGQPLCSIQPSKALVAYQSVVERAWKFVMKAGVGDCTDDFCDPSIPFFDIWGGLIAAAQLSAFYRQEGIQITMEEVLSHPTIGLQTLLVAQRSGVK